jgi:hypothetical protein
MNTKVLWIVLFVGFATINLYALIAGGFAALGEYLRNLGAWGLLATADLLMALLLAVVWMWRDARAKRVAPLPYALLTLATGSLGLLLYLIRHDNTARKASALPRAASP